MEQSKQELLVAGHKTFMANAASASYSKSYDFAFPFLLVNTVDVSIRLEDTILSFKDGSYVVLPKGDALSYVDNVAHLLNLPTRPLVRTVMANYKPFVQKLFKKPLIRDLELFDLMIDTDRLINVSSKRAYHYRKTAQLTTLHDVTTPAQVQDCLEVLRQWSTIGRNRPTEVQHVIDYLNNLTAIQRHSDYRVTALAVYAGERCVAFAIGTLLKEGLWSCIARMTLRDVDKRMLLDPYIWTELAKRFLDCPLSNDGAGGGEGDSCHAHKVQMGCVMDTNKVVNLRKAK